MADVLKRLGIVVTFPIWATLGVLGYMLFALFCWVWGMGRWIGTGKPVMETAENMWLRMMR